MTEIQLKEGKFFKTLLALSIPAMLAQFVNILYNIVDRIYIGNLDNVGSLALAGVGICAPIMMVISSFSFLVGLGSSPLISMKLGENKKAEAQKILSNAVLLLLFFSFMLFLVFFVFKENLLYLFGATKENFKYANEYFSVYIFAIFGSILALGLNMFITCQGKSLISMVSVLIGAVLNILLDPIFIYVFGLGVQGAAIATLIAQYSSLLFICYHLFYNKSFILRLKLKLEKIDFVVVKKILFFGLSPFLVYVTEGFIVIFMNMSIKSHMGLNADIYIASLTIVLSFFQLLTYPMGGLTQGSQPLISYNVGAKNVQRVRKTVYTLLLFCIILSVVIFSIAMINPLFFVKIFTNEPNLIALTVSGIKIYTLGAVFLAFQYAFVDSLLAMGKPKIAMFLSLFRKLIVFTPLVFLLPKYFSNLSIFYAEPISDIIAGVLTTIVFMLLIRKITFNNYDNTTTLKVLSIYENKTPK